MHIRSLFTIILIISGLGAIAQTIKYDKVGSRRIAIYLPEGYDSLDGPFKTVYFYDGQNSFTNSPYSWKFQEEITQLIANNSIQRIIGVGIYTDVNRTDDLVPYYDPYVEDDWGPYKAKGDKFADFVVELVIPFIEAQYKVGHQSEDRALIGVSFGGLHAIYTGLTHKDSFSFVAGISPSFWVDNFHIFKTMKKAEKGPDIWFDIGTGEWNYNVPAIPVLEEIGYEYGKNLFYYEQPDATHESKYWKERIKYPLILFAGENNEAISNIEVKLEVIKGVNSKKYYLRLNPILTRENGVKFSLCTSAEYSLLNEGVAKINDDGSFEFLKEEDFEVKISYRDWQKIEKISYSEIKLKMNN